MKELTKEILIHVLFVSCLGIIILITFNLIGDMVCDEQKAIEQAEYMGGPFELHMLIAPLVVAFIMGFILIVLLRCSYKSKLKGGTKK